MVLPAARAPLEEVVKPTVQVAVALADRDEPEKVTAVGGGSSDGHGGARVGGGRVP